MSANAIETSEFVTPSFGDRIVDAGRHAAHLSHKARLAKSLAEDAVEDGVYAAKRAAKSVRRGIERLEDVRDEGIHFVKRQPLKSIAIVAGVGFAAGLVAGWMAGGFSSSRG